MTAPVPPPQGVRRSRTGAVLGGVCAGVARSAGLDPLLLRIALVAVSLLTGGAAVLAYLAAWVLVPREESTPGTALPADPASAGSPRRGVTGSAGTTGEEAGTPVRAAWTTVGQDLRVLAAELRRPAQEGPAQQGPAQQGPAQQGPAQQGPAQQGPAQQGPAQQGPAQQGPAEEDPAQETPAAAAATEPGAETSAPPEGGIPAPRSPLTTADDAATALGERLRAPEVQAGARKAAASVSEALSASVDELGRRVRRDPG